MLIFTRLVSVVSCQSCHKCVNVFSSRNLVQNFLDKNIDYVMFMADKFKIKPLCELCEHYIAEKVSCTYPKISPSWGI